MGPVHPLRIAFFGTDEFSIKSLTALHKYQSRFPSYIKQLDLITRAPKRGGRGRKLLKETPSTGIARSLNITTHFADTKEEINALQGHGYNMAIAVSYGSFISSKLLSSLQYGGLNVHPSLLPQLRGPAPIHHALLNKLDTTGVTIQTLDTRAYDRGEIVYQTEPVAINKTAKFGTLYSQLGDLGAQALVKAIDEQLFILNLKRHVAIRPESYAPKLGLADKEINLTTQSIDDILLRSRVFDQLHFFQTILLRGTTKERKQGAHGVKRIIMTGLQNATGQYSELDLQLGEYTIKDEKCIIKVNGGMVLATGIQVEGFPLETPKQFLKYAKKRGFYNFKKEQYNFKLIPS